MSNERKDEFLSWRGLLDSPEGVPGQGLDDREQTWERLMDRFREKPRRRLPVYGIVAACLLLAVIPASRLFQGRHPSPRPGGPRQITPLVVRPDGGRKTFSSPTPAVVPAPEEKLAVQVGSPDGGAAKRTDDAGSKRPHAGRPKANSGVHQEMKTVALTDDTVHTPAALAALAAPAAPLLVQWPPTKAAVKWKVVDLNELGPGQNAPYRMASGRRESWLRIGPGMPNAGDERVPYGPPAEQTGIRIKLSSSN
jgi:hypothetical protein